MITRKKFSPKYCNYLTGGIAACIIIVCITYFFLQNRAVSKKSNQTIQNLPSIAFHLNKSDTFLYKKWVERINQIGPSKAYQEFKSAYLYTNVSVAHHLAHIMGIALYDTEGLPGLSVCDSSFSYGCYHSFLSKAIISHGIGIVPFLNTACRKRLGDEASRCQHGMGHGILSSIGYSYNDLIKALTVCKTISENNVLGGCFGGVFMEFYFRTVLFADGIVRPFTASDPGYPCQALPSVYRPKCYAWNSQWLLSVLPSGTITKKLNTVSRLCETLTTQEQKSCYLGEGYNIGLYVNLDTELAIGTCNSIFSSQGRLLCRAASFSRYRASNINAYEKLCTESMTQQQTAICKQTADSIEVVFL